MLTVQLKRNTSILVFDHLNQSRPLPLLGLEEIDDFFFLELAITFVVQEYLNTA